MRATVSFAILSHSPSCRSTVRARSQRRASRGSPIFPIYRYPVLLRSEHISVSRASAPTLPDVILKLPPPLLFLFSFSSSIASVAIAFSLLRSPLPHYYFLPSGATFAVFLRPFHVSALLQNRPPPTTWTRLCLPLGCFRRAASRRRH